MVIAIPASAPVSIGSGSEKLTKYADNVRLIGAAMIASVGLARFGSFNFLSCDLHRVIG